MAYIKVRKQSDGSTRYTAIIRLRSGKTIVHQEARTFAHRSAAVTWAKHREIALEDPTALTRVQQGTPTLAELIRWYIETFATISKWQRSKQTHLEFLERHALGKSDALNLTSAMLIDHARSRRAKGAGPATVANDLIWIGVVLRAARSVKELPVRPEIVKEARDACAELRLTGKARRRARRPTPDELQRLREYFARRDRRSKIPMQSVLEFALNSARRESEICRLEWRDNDDRNQTGMVRDAKHPTAREGNHRRFKYTPEAWAVVQVQPRTSAYVFPYDPRSIGAAFTKACHVLQIRDLRFTLHDSWNELKRYTNLKPENVRSLTPPVTPGGARRHSRASIRRASQPDLFAGQSTLRDRSH
jgi:integrase